MKYKHSITLLLLLFSVQLFGQQKIAEVSKKELRKSRPTYINIGMGFSYSYFRDFATSPLIYHGLPVTLSLSRLKFDKKRESILGVNYSIGSYSNLLAENNTSSITNTFTLNYTQLYQILEQPSEKWNFKIGGTFNSITNVRINGALQNNALGLESISTIFVSAKISRDLSRTELQEKKLIFFNYQLKPIKRIISYQLNLAVMNNTLRNGYIYNDQAAITNEFAIFDNHVFKVFSGYRISSSLNYNIYLKNCNAMRISYIWDAYKTGGDLDKFEMASHNLQFSLLFNTK